MWVVSLNIYYYFIFYAGKNDFAIAVAPALANVSTPAFAPLTTISFSVPLDDELGCCILVSGGISINGGISSHALPPVSISSKHINSSRY